MTPISAERDAQSIQVAVLGSTGRMGREVTKALEAHPFLSLGAALDRSDLQNLLVAQKKVERCDLFIDFTTMSAQERVMQLLYGQSDTARPLITGVTGLKESAQNELLRYANLAPVFQASNFSIGVALLNRLAALAAESLGDHFDAEIFELHHRHKLDAPSGTALSLAEAVVRGKQLAGDQRAIVKTEATTPRNSSEVHLSAGRGGGVFGDHSLFFLGEHERLELKHAAIDRAVFASGALRAAEWCLERPPGHYQMDHLWDH